MDADLSPFWQVQLLNLFVVFSASAPSYKATKNSASPQGDLTFFQNDKILSINIYYINIARVKGV